MNRLGNALAFAAVVIAGFVMDSNLPQRVASNPLVAQVVRQLRSRELPAVGSLDGLPQPLFDEARLKREMARMQAAQERLAQVKVRQAEARIRMADAHISQASTTCKIVRVGQ